MHKASVLLVLFCGLSLLILAATVPAAGEVAAAGVPSLPWTGADTGHTPLVLLGMAILAAGVVLLRRSVVVPNP